MMFGKRKLTASPLKAAVEADVQILQALGAGRREDVRHGVIPRLRRLLRTISDEVSRGTGRLEERRPIIEFIASKVPGAWLEVAQLYSEQGGQEGLERSRDCLRRYLEDPEPGRSTVNVWRYLAELCRRLDDPVGEVHALVEMCLVQDVAIEQISGAANRINNIYQELKQRGISLLDSQERRILVRKVADVMGSRMPELDATDCSRLAWLHMHLRDVKRVSEVAQKGFELDPANEHCLRLLERVQ